MWPPLLHEYILISTFVNISINKNFAHYSAGKRRGKGELQIRLYSDNTPSQTKQHQGPEDNFPHTEPRLAVTRILFTYDQMLGYFAALEYVGHLPSLLLNKTITTNKPDFEWAGMWQSWGNSTWPCANIAEPKKAKQTATLPALDIPYVEHGFFQPHCV
ncbi:MAG: hypothetical protein V4628_02995 [Pseudomonadota bacterium]